MIGKLNSIEKLVSSPGEPCWRGREEDGTVQTFQSKPQRPSLPAMADNDQDLWATMGMPMAFGKQSKKKTVQRSFDEAKRGAVSGSSTTAAARLC